MKFYGDIQSITFYSNTHTAQEGIHKMLNEQNNNTLINYKKNKNNTTQYRLRQPYTAACDNRLDDCH